MDKIMLVDSKSEHGLKQVPSKTDTLSKEFKVIPHDFGNLEKLFMRSEYGLTQLNKLDKTKAYALVKSPLYTNCYYPIDKFDEYYKSDLRKIMYRLSGFMGARLFGFDIVEKSEYEDFKKSNIGGDITIGVIQGLISTNTSHSSSSHKKYKSINLETFIHEAKDSITKKKNKFELQEWINRKNININALPSYFKSLLNVYLESGEINGKVEKLKSVDIESSAINISNISISAKIDILKLPYNIGASFNYTDEVGYKSLKQYTMIYVYDFGN